MPEYKGPFACGAKGENGASAKGTRWGKIDKNPQHYGKEWEKKSALKSQNEGGNVEKS